MGGIRGSTPSGANCCLEASAVREKLSSPTAHAEQLNIHPLTPLIDIFLSRVLFGISDSRSVSNVGASSSSRF